MALATSSPDAANVEIRRAARIEFGENVMGIFGALTTAVGGLQAHSFALENISGNIANSQTTAYKRVDTSFLDLIPQTDTDRAAGGRRHHAIPLHQLGAGRRADGLGRDQHGDQRQRLLRGAEARQHHRQHAGVRRRRPTIPAAATSSSTSSGNLVNGAGYYLQGVPIDPNTGNPSGSSPQVLQFQNNFLPAQADDQDRLCAPTSPAIRSTTKHDVSVPGSELIAPGSL